LKNTYTYDVAISFAEEDRNAALALSQALELEGLKAYYYPDERTLGWGKNLEEQLSNIYAEQARYAIVLFSEHYFSEHKIYTKIELAAIQKRMEEDADIVYMLPVRLHEGLSVTEFPNLDKLIFFKWNYAPSEIAQEINKLLGKELLNAEENADADNIIYNYGNQTMFIAGSGAKNVNQTIVFSSGENPIVITKKDGESVNVQQFNFSRPKDTKYPCPYCSIELGTKKYGINECINCGKIFYIENPAIDVLKYKTLDKIEAKEYNKIRAHIRNKIRDRDYLAAYQYCLKAEEIAPAESNTWEHFALTGFLVEIYREKNTRMSTQDIIRIVKCHTEKCKDCGISDDDYDGMVVDIANRLFMIEKSRINSLRAQYKDDLGYEKWTRQNFQYLKTLLRSFEICYGLFNDTLYLEEYVNELTKPNKWMEKTLDTEDIVNTMACGGFNAYEKLNTLVTKIREKKVKYNQPAIAEQRFIVLSVETSEEVDANTDISSTITTAIETTNGKDEINIISIE